MNRNDDDELDAMNQKNGLDRILSELKKSIFSVLYVLLTEDDAGFIYFVLEYGLDWIQMLQFPFDDKISAVWKSSGVLNIVFQFFNFFNLINYLQDAITWNTFVATFYITIVFIVLILLDIIYVSYSFQRKKFAMVWPLLLLRTIVTLTVTVLFIPITELLLSMFSCTTNSTGELVFDLFPDIVCFTGMHLVHVVVGSVIGIIFILVSLVVTMNNFEIRITSQDITARSNSLGDVAFIINKIVLQLSFVFLPVTPFPFPLYSRTGK